MKQQEIYYRFNKENQADYEKLLLDRLRNSKETSHDDSSQKKENWTKADWEQTKAEFDKVNAELTEMLKKYRKPNSLKFQNIIRKHCQWLKKFWNFTD